MLIRFPAPLRPGDRIGVTAPSSGVGPDLRPRLEFCLDHLRAAGYEVVLGACLDGTGAVSAPARARAAELTDLLTDPSIRAVVPPWGGELAVEVLPYLDLDAIRAAEPTWLVGYSDMSTLLLPLTTLTGLATLHGQNLMDTPYRLPEPIAHWLDVVSRPPGATVVQGSSTRHRGGGPDRWQDDPKITEFTLDRPGTWSLLDDPGGEAHVSGRLIGGCIEVISVLAGTRYGDLGRFRREHAPEGLILYVEAAEADAFDVARALWRMRLAGWFDEVGAVLVGRTQAPDAAGFTQVDAVRSVLGNLRAPVVLDVDCGHVPPQLALVNGALAELSVLATESLLTQHLR